MYLEFEKPPKLLTRNVKGYINKSTCQDLSVMFNQLYLDVKAEDS